MNAASELFVLPIQQCVMRKLRVGAFENAVNKIWFLLGLFSFKMWNIHCEKWFGKLYLLPKK